MRGGTGVKLCGCGIIYILKTANHQSSPVARQSSPVKPLLIIVAGPSGAGKSTLCKRLLAEFPGIRYSVSCTTRAPRGEEKHGTAYHFLSAEEFGKRLAAGEFLEHAEVHGNRYGTLKSSVAGVLESGGSVLMDIDVEGAAQVRGIVGTLPRGDLMREGFRDVFIDPPSLEELKLRIEKRGEDAPEVIAKRLENARKEMARGSEFAFRIVNADFDEAYARFKRIVTGGFHGKKLILLDLDGTVYAENAAIPGAAEFVRKCAQRGIRCAYVTNRANRTRAEVKAQLSEMGIPCTEQDIVTTAVAAAERIGGGAAFVVGEHGLLAALEERGVRIVNGAGEKPDFVVVGLDRFFTYDKLRRAAEFIRAGARFVATNRDACLITDAGLIPGSGAIVAAVATAAGREPDEVVGKPEKGFIEMVLKTFGAPKNEALIVGDNIETDIGAGVNAGVETALMLTGVSGRSDAEKAKFKPDAVAENFAELEGMLF